MSAQIRVAGHTPGGILAARLLARAGLEIETVTCAEDEAFEQFLGRFSRPLAARPPWLERALAFAQVELELSPSASIGPVDVELPAHQRLRGGLPAVGEAGLEAGPSAVSVGEALLGTLPPSPEGWWARRQRRERDRAVFAAVDPGANAAPLALAATAMLGAPAGTRGALELALGSDAPRLTGRGLRGGPSAWTVVTPEALRSHAGPWIDATALGLGVERATGGGRVTSVGMTSVRVADEAWPEAWAPRVLHLRARAALAAVVERGEDAHRVHLLHVGPRADDTRFAEDLVVALAPLAKPLDVDAVVLARLSADDPGVLKLGDGRWPVPGGFVARAGVLGALNAATWIALQLALQVSPKEAGPRLLAALRA